jgi:hypothetical protein
MDSVYTNTDAVQPQPPTVNNDEDQARTVDAVIPQAYG